MVLWILYIALDALISWYLIERKKTNIDHLQATIIRGIAFVLLGGLQDITPVQFIPWLVFTTTSFWIFFDVWLNLLRGKKIWYIGENASVDKFGLKSTVTYWTLKAIAFIAWLISVQYLRYE